MKRLLLFLTMALTLFGVTRAETVEFDFKNNTYGAGPAYTDGNTAYVTTNNVAKQSDVSVTFTGSSNTAWRFWSDGIRAYKNQNAVFTVAVPTGKNITSITWTAASGATYALDGTNNNITSWSGEAESVAFKYTNTGSNLALIKLTVVYKANAVKEDVSLSFPEKTYSAEKNEGFKAPSLTVNPAAASSEVKYSSSNTSVASVNESTGAVTLNGAGSTTITASISNSSTYNDASTDYTLTVTDNTQGGEDPTPGGTSQTIIFVAGDQGYENSKKVESATISPVTFNFNKGTNNNNDPTYYTSDQTLRVYGGNYFTVSVQSGYLISKIILTLTKDGSNAITTDCETFDSYSNTWTGSAESVKFTIDGSSGGRRIVEIDVICAQTGTGEPTLQEYIAPFDGQTYTFTEGETNATIPVNDSHPTLNFSYNPEGIVTIDNDGNVTINGTGTTTVTASWGDNNWNEGSATFSVTVNANSQGGEETTPGETSEVTFDFVNKDYGLDRKSGNANDGYLSNSQSITQDDITLTFYSGNGNNAWRLWSDGLRAHNNGSPYFTISVNNGKITNVSLDANGNFKVGEDETSSKSLTWSGEEETLTLYYDNSGNTALKTLTIKYILDQTTDPDPEVKELGEIIATVSDGQTLEDADDITITKGTSITFTSENATKIELSCEEAEIELEEDGNTLTWKPDILLQEGYVLVKASAEIDGKTAEKEFLFIINVVNPQIGDIKATYLGKTVENDSKFTVHKGTKFTFSAENATSILVEGAIMNEDNSDFDALHTLVEADSDEVTWTATEPYENMHIVVTAWVDKENDLENNATMSFNITVDEPKTDEGHTNPHAGDKYEMITDVADLLENCHYVIAYTGGNVAMSTATVTNGQMGGDTVEIQDGILTATDNTLVFNLTTDDNGNYLWNFVNYSGNSNASPGLGNTSGTNFTVTNLTPSTIVFSENGDAEITFTNNTDNLILYRDGYNFKYYSRQNANSSGYHTVQIYKLSSWEERYYDFTHEFKDQTVGKDKEIVLFDDDEEYPSNLNFVVETPGIIEITKDGVITGLEIGSTNVTVSWEKDEVNKFNASEGTITFNVEVIEEMSGMFDFTKENPYGMTSTNVGTYYEPTSIRGKEGDVNMTLDGKFRSWQASKGIELRMYENASLTFFAPLGYKLESIDFTCENNALNNFKVSTGEIDAKEWKAVDDVTTKSVTFTADKGTVTILTATVNYARCEGESVYIFGTVIGSEWNDGDEPLDVTDGVFFRENQDLELRDGLAKFYIVTKDENNIVTGKYGTNGNTPQFITPNEAMPMEGTMDEVTPFVWYIGGEFNITVNFKDPAAPTVTVDPQDYAFPEEMNLIGANGKATSSEGVYTFDDIAISGGFAFSPNSGDGTALNPIFVPEGTLPDGAMSISPMQYYTEQPNFTDLATMGCEKGYYDVTLDLSNVPKISGSITPATVKIAFGFDENDTWNQSGGFNEDGGLYMTTRQNGVYIYVSSPEGTKVKYRRTDMSEYNESNAKGISLYADTSFPIDEEYKDADTYIDKKVVWLPANSQGNLSLKYVNEDAEIETIPVTYAFKVVKGETTDIDSIEAEGEVEYYTLDGLKVNAENLQNGLYIVKKGNKVVKAMIRK